MSEIFVIPLVSFNMENENHIKQSLKDNTCVLYFSFGDFLYDYQQIKRIESQYNINVNFINCEKLFKQYILFGNQYGLLYDFHDKQKQLINQITLDFINYHFKNFKLVVYYL